MRSCSEGINQLAPVMEDSLSPWKKKKRRKKIKKEELSGTARSLLSCARSPKCRWVIEWGSAGSCKSRENERGASPPSVGGEMNQSYFISRLVLCRGGTEADWNYSLFFPFFGCSAETCIASEEDKGGSLSSGRKWCSPPILVALRGDKGKSTLTATRVPPHCRCECISEEVNSMLFAHYLQAQNCWWQGFSIL